MLMQMMRKDWTKALLIYCNAFTPNSFLRIHIKWISIYCSQSNEKWCYFSILMFLCFFSISFLQIEKNSAFSFIAANLQRSDATTVFECSCASFGAQIPWPASRGNSCDSVQHGVRGLQPILCRVLTTLCVFLWRIGHQPTKYSR